MQIQKETIIGDILKKSPQAIEVFSRYDMDAACCEPADTSLELAAQDAGADIDVLIADLDKHLNEDASSNGKKPSKITPDMKVDEIVSTFPQVADIITEYGLHCVGCHVAAWETLEQGARGHGMSEEEIEDLVQDLNDAIKSEATQ